MNKYKVHSELWADRYQARCRQTDTDGLREFTPLSAGLALCRADGGAGEQSPATPPSQPGK